MVKVGKSRNFLSDRVWVDATIDELSIGVTDSEFTRRQVQKIVAELEEWLAETAPRRVS